MLGLFDWNEPIQSDIPSKSKLKQTELELLAIEDAPFSARAYGYS
jgi:hypothetical protein